MSIANPIGYPKVNPTPNPIGFRSPDPVPDTRPRYPISSHVFDSSLRPTPIRHLGDAPIPERWGWGC